MKRSLLCEDKITKRKNESIDRPKIRVLSLNDGIGTSFYVLTKLGFDIGVYYASDMDENATLVTKFHYGDNIKHIGPITEIDNEKLNKIGPIDFLIGGSLCTDFTNSNYIEKEIFDPNGMPILFFDYYRIWNHFKNINKLENRKFFWMFQNTVNVEITTNDTISSFLDSNPYIIDSVYTSAIKHKRYFWSNIPKVECLQRTIEDDNNIGPVLNEYLDENLGRKATVNKMCTMATRKGCSKNNREAYIVQVEPEISSCCLFITEIEKIVGFPPHYTDVCNFNNKTRQNLLGRSWSTQVLEEVFNLLKEHFKQN